MLEKLTRFLHLERRRKPADPKSEDFDENLRSAENRSAAAFFLGFLVLCSLVAVVRFSFYMWIVELSCGIVCVAIFMFAFNIDSYSTDSSALWSGVGFLFTCAFEAAYGYVVVRSGSRDFRLAQPGLFLWICTQWYLAFSFLIILNRKRPRMALKPVFAIYFVLFVALISFHLWLPGIELLITNRYRRVYLATNAFFFVLLYGYMLFRLRRMWGEQPEYFSRRMFGAIVVAVIACIGCMYTIDSGPGSAFAFNFLRFLALALCYNANVTFILLTPYQAMYGEIASRAEQLTEANRHLNAALEEKEVLLSEVHHRVKNNLQVISSLLNLQSYHYEDKGIREAFEESQNRIRAMALVHEMLYQNRNFAAIDYAVYLERMLRELFGSFGRPGIQNVVDCGTVFVPIDTAITCSLIVNELVTNSIKHAFPGGRRGTVSVRLRATPSQIELEVEDDGIGLRPDLEIGKLKSMGFSLLASLTLQLKGRYAISGDDGTRITITFPNDSPKPEIASKTLRGR